MNELHQAQPNPNARMADELVKAWTEKLQAKAEIKNPVTAPDVARSLEFRIRDDQVEAVIRDRTSGEIVRTIPPSDLRQLMEENFHPTLGNLIDLRA